MKHKLFTNSLLGCTPGKLYSALQSAGADRNVNRVDVYIGRRFCFSTL